MAQVVTSAEEICNIALSLLGAEEIENLSDQTKEAMLCNRQYGRIRDSVLRQHTWNFAVRRVALPQDDATPVFEYDYQFSMPADFMRMVRTDAAAAGYDEDYRIESTSDGMKLLSNDGVVSIEYVAKITNVALFDAAFVDVLTARLAAEMAYPLTDNATLAQNMMTLFQDKLREARNLDATEGTPREISRSGWLEGMFN